MEQMMNYQITGDREAILRGLRGHYGKETRQAAWERVKKIAKARTARAAGKFKVCPQQVSWDFCLFVAERERRRK
jgi:hypothetical protein